MKVQEFIDMCKAKKWDDLKAFLYSNTFDISFKITASAVIDFYHSDKETIKRYGLAVWNDFLSDRSVSQYESALSISVDLIDFANAYNRCKITLADEKLANTIVTYVKINKFRLAPCLNTNTVSQQDKETIKQMFGDITISEAELEAHKKAISELQEKEKSEHTQSINQLNMYFEKLFGLNESQFNFSFVAPTFLSNGVKLSRNTGEGEIKFTVTLSNEAINKAEEFLKNLGVNSNFYDMNWRFRPRDARDGIIDVKDYRGIQLWDKPQSILIKISEFERFQKDEKLLPNEDKSQPLAKQRLFAASKNLEEFKSIVSLNYLAKKQKLEKALLTAADKCDAKEIAQILSEVAEKNIKIAINSIRNSRNETLLMLAASGNRKIPHGQSYEAVQRLLQAGADPLLTSNDGRTALMEAANFGRVSVVNLLISSVPSNNKITYIIQADDVGTTAKGYAGQKGHFVDVHERIGKILDDRIAETKDEIANLKFSPRHGT